MRWIPLEANPEALNKYIKQLGAPNDWEFVDVYGLDDELLSMVPQPCISVVLLFPLTQAVKNCPIGAEKPECPGFFMKQTIGNACGTVAVVHALSNTKQITNMQENSLLLSIIEKMEKMTPAERASAMEKETQLSCMHEQTANEGQTKAPDEEIKTDLHFVCFCEVDGEIYEFDGRRNAPVLHGKASNNGLLLDCAGIIKKFIARDPTNVNFNMMAMVKKSD